MPLKALPQHEDSIICYRDEEDAVRIANDTIYGLVGGVWSGNEERAVKFERHVREAVNNELFIKE